MNEIQLVKHASGAPGLRFFGFGPKLIPQKGILKLKSLLNKNTLWAQKRSSKNIKKMLSNSTIIVSAWENSKLIGFGRATSDGIFRGSIRSNNKINVCNALNECSEILIAHGGHSAAAGFTIKEENIPKLKQMLNNIAIREFKKENLAKSIKPDAYICFKDINYDKYSVKESIKKEKKAFKDMKRAVMPPQLN